MQFSDNSYLNAVATTLIRNLAGLYTLEVSPLARDFLNNPGITARPDDAGLIALLCLEFESVQTSEVRTALLAQVRAADSLNQETRMCLVKRQCLQQEVHSYFMMSEHMLAQGLAPPAINYWQVALPAHPVAFLLLDLASKRLANGYAQQFEDAGKTDYVVEAYNHPIDRRPGIWMSVTGVRFDPAQLRD